MPRSYLSLQEAVLAEQQRRSLGDDVQYLTDRQLQQLVEQTPGNDIDDYEDLQSGGRGTGDGGGGPQRAAGGVGLGPREGRAAQPFHRSANDRRCTVTSIWGHGWILGSRRICRDGSRG